MKSSLWSFANIASTVCVSDDAVGQRHNLILSMADKNSPARRSDFHSRIVMLRRISHPLSRNKERVRKFQIRQSSSTSAVGTLTIRPLKYQMTVHTLWLNSRDP